MLILVLLGLASLISAGGLLLFFPNSLSQLNDDFKKVVNKATITLDEQVLRLHVGIGICCILISLTCFFLVYWIIKKHG